MKNLIFFPLAMLLSCLTMAQTIVIPGNQYAFQYQTNTNFGMYFNQTDISYDLRNGAANAIFSIDADSGYFKKDIVFAPGKNLLVDGDDYAFRYFDNPNYGLYFNESDVSFDFRNGAAAKIFSIDATNGKFKTNISLSPGSDFMVDGDRYAFRYSAALNYGLFFNSTDGRYEFRTLNASPIFHIGANSGDLYTPGKVGINTKTPTTALDVHGELSFEETLGDKISLYGDRIGANDIYGFAVSSAALDYKSSGAHRWLTHTAPTPSAPQDVSMILTLDGKLGLGTPTPDVNMVIQGDNSRLKLQDGAGNNSENAARIELLEYENGNFNSGAFFWYNGDQDKLFMGSKQGGVNTNIMVMSHNGLNVGIGTQNPHVDYRLSVNGKIRAKEIVVEAGWADFVFKDDYNLRSLAEVESFISENGHLPEIPSAQHIQEHGVPVGEIESKLLQKIEELTLYVINLNKENEEIRNRLNQVEKQQQ